jgi:multimeric flavodoxin WrbA
MAVLILNGSPQGRNGNCQKVAALIAKKRLKTEVLALAEIDWSDSAIVQKIFKQLQKAQGFIFITGTYWDSWGSPLQTFLEQVTPLEGSPAFLGKPAMVIVLNHSVGGKSVLSRLQGVLSTLGCLIPPMSGMVYSWVNDQLLSSDNKSESFKDLWSLDDIEDILENFKRALKISVKWKSWPVDKKDYRQIWLK